MDCAKIEQWLSEYMEHSLAADEMSQMKKHLDSCPNCAALLREMKSLFSSCRSYPTLELDPDVLETILLRTSGRPRTRTFGERFNLFFIRPLLTPRIAAGISLLAMSLGLGIHLMMPRMSAVSSAMSPSGLLQLMDRGVQQVYGQGLKAYVEKNYWQSQLDYYVKNAWKKTRFMIEQIDVPVEGRQKSEEPQNDKQRPSGEKSSWLPPQTGQAG